MYVWPPGAREADGVRASEAAEQSDGAIGMVSDEKWRTTAVHSYVRIKEDGKGGRSTGV